MSSILTNSSAMVALQTMKGINSNLTQVQSEISTGKAIGSSKDNAAVWAISKTMESDVSSFKGVTDALSVGSSTVAVARTAAETVTNLLTEMKTKIVAAQGGSDADRTKIQTDVVALREQIGAVVGAAQLNGVNLVNGGAGMDVLSSLNRNGATVETDTISVAAQNLSIGGYTAKAAFTGTTGASTGADTFGATMDATTGTTDVVFDDTAGFAAGDSISLTIGGKSATYTFSKSDIASATPADLAAVGMKNAIEKLGIDGLEVSYDSGTAGTLTLTNTSGNDMVVSGQFSNANAGGLGGLAAIDVSTAAGATAALGAIDGLLTTATNAAASFGSSERRLSMQSDFVSKLSDTLKNGIGAMVDANMEEASARLQALQVQQQLGIQALSIANQAPQSIMSLFR
ncbi:flagellin [Falsirhodobacter xinxiangensis]|uniref:flagellin n=1 Tax=Falsirhodobacter xinxiangensis TaxID=2530049 RepID=UPI0010A9F75C|nr:flagellin [Rhodobacter xinxiangensis]